MDAFAPEFVSITYRYNMSSVDMPSAIALYEITCQFVILCSVWTFLTPAFKPTSLMGVNMFLFHHDDFTTYTELQKPIGLKNTFYLGYFGFVSF